MVTVLFVTGSMLQGLIVTGPVQGTRTVSQDFCHFLYYFPSLKNPIWDIESQAKKAKRFEPKKRFLDHGRFSHP